MLMVMVDGDVSMPDVVVVPTAPAGSSKRLFLEPFLRFGASLEPLLRGLRGVAVVKETEKRGRVP
jgi:hypothetical protein